MITNVLIGILFFLSSILEMSLINALNFSFSLIPLNLILGILILHRAGAYQGVVWFLMSAVFLNLFGFNETHFVSYIVVAVVGSFLSIRFFTNRSVYALIGLGTALYTVFFFVNLTLHFETEQILKIFILQMIYVIFGLYIAFLISRYIEHIALDLFMIRKK